MASKNNPWREKSVLYCDPSRIWRHVNLALSTCPKTSELLECPSPPTHCQGLWPPWHSLAQEAGASNTGALAATERRKALSLTFVCPSVLHQARERQGNLLLTFLGPLPFTKKKLNGTYGAICHSSTPSAQH